MTDGFQFENNSKGEVLPQVSKFYRSLSCRSNPYFLNQQDENLCPHFQRIASSFLKV